jgi:hypothetical protein
MSQHLPSLAPTAGDIRRDAARASGTAFHEREVRLVRESLWRRPQGGPSTKRGR